MKETRMKRYTYLHFGLPLGFASLTTSVLTWKATFAMFNINGMLARKGT